MENKFPQSSSIKHTIVLFLRIPPKIGFWLYLPRQPKVKTKDSVGSQEHLASVTASTSKPPKRPKNKYGSMYNSAIRM